MTVGIGSLVWAMVSQGDILGAITFAFTNYPVMNFGLIWILLGFGFYATLYFKTDADWGVCGALLTIYLASVSAMFSPMIWVVFGMVLIVHMVLPMKKIFMR